MTAGAGRFSLAEKTKDKILEKGEIDVEEAVKFIERGKFDVVVTSSGDDHSKQAKILAKRLEGRVQVFALNKTMDDDLGGVDGIDGAPYTDFTNGYHTAVSTGVEQIKNHFAGAWTNNLPYIVAHFGRDTNWVGLALSYWGFADRFIYGELAEEHPGHNIEKIHQMILESQKKNEEIYGRRFAMIVVAEGTRVSGVKHVSDLIDPHGHHKLQPAVLAAKLKEELEKRFGMKTQNEAITYTMRNFHPSEKDIRYSLLSSQELARGILAGKSGLESVFKIRNGKVEVGLEPIEKVAVTRFASYYEKVHGSLVDKDTFEVTDEIGKYYKPLFGERGKLSDILPKKMRKVVI